MCLIIHVDSNQSDPAHTIPYQCACIEWALCDSLRSMNAWTMEIRTAVPGHTTSYYGHVKLEREPMVPSSVHFIPGVQRYRSMLVDQSDPLFSFPSAGSSVQWISIHHLIQSKQQGAKSNVLETDYVPAAVIFDLQLECFLFTFPCL